MRRIYFIILMLLCLFALPSYAQIWEGEGGDAIQEGFGFGGNSGGSGGFDWDDFTGEKCTITFQSLDGSYSQSALVPVGVPSEYVMSAVSVPSKTGYDIDGWSYLNNYPTPVAIPDNFIATTTYYVIYTPHTHDVTFMLDNSVYHVEQNVAYGTAIPLPTPPTYPDIPQDNVLYYWQGLPDTMPDNDVTVTAVYGIGYWGIDINQSTGDITYLARAQNMYPVSVTGDTINNWNDNATSWKSFVYDIARPCMLKSDGTVDYYLNRDDQRYKEDGVTASDYNNTSYDGNAMVEFKKMYIKITEPETNIIRVLFSQSKIDNGFTAYAFTDENGNEVDKVYLGMFVGSVVGDKLRSIIGGSNSSIKPNELESKAVLNGSGWNIEYYSLRNYINLLSVMVMKTLKVSTIGYNVTNCGGTTVSANDNVLVNKNAFAVHNPTNETVYYYKLFWIKDYFINNHLTRGIAYDATNSCWLFKNTPPYSSSLLDYTGYLSCASNNLTFHTVLTSGYIRKILLKMAVSDNLLFPYEEFELTSSTTGNALTPYGNSPLSNFRGGSVSALSGKWKYVCFGAHNLAHQWITNYNNIWNTQIGDSTQDTWTNGVIRASLTYMPQGSGN